MERSQIKVCVGMSGGVDSSLTAALLKEEGYDVFGLFMKNWDEEDESGRCTAEKDFEDVVKVCTKLGIPYYSINFTKEYEERVFSHFLDELKKGKTPNPDILCNREIKFSVFFDKAMELGADFLATGHYAQTKDGRLLEAMDQSKDQTYFLHAVTTKALEKTLFPLGAYTKKQVREEAEKRKLATAAKKDSTGICFIGKRDFKSFVQKYLPYQEGPILTTEGTYVGTHSGVAFYTIGQRKGLGIGGPGAAYFVCGKDLESNTLIVCQGDNHPALFTKELSASACFWIKDQLTPPFACTAKIRYRGESTPCTVTQDGDLLQVTFTEPVRAATPGQSIVFYKEGICLGGAVIEATPQQLHALSKMSTGLSQ